jgi:Tol biopolymer transport system component
MAAAAAAKEVAMRRWFVLMVMVTASLGWIGLVAPAQAKAPGPNGQILFVRDTRTCEGCHLTTLNPDGTHGQEIPNGSESRWSPDGSRIASIFFQDDGRLGTMVFDPDGSNATTFAIPDPTLNLPCVTWAPDASRLLCEGWDDAHPHRAPGLFTVEATDGQDLVRLTRNPFGGHDLPEDFSPDGTRIVFLRENPTRRHRQFSIWVANADGSEQAQVTPWLSNSLCCVASWSPDGSTILFALKGSLRTMAPDGTGLMTIALDSGPGFAYASKAGWSPDGTRIVFSLFLETAGQVDLYTATADGTDLVQLTDSRTPKGGADWGPHPLATDA